MSRGALYARTVPTMAYATIMPIVAGGWRGDVNVYRIPTVMGEPLPMLERKLLMLKGLALL